MIQEKDNLQLINKGITKESIESQIANFKCGFDFISLEAPAIPGDGLVVVDNNEVENLVEYFNEEMKSLTAVKFVPASGAASRMFKSLFEFVEKFQKGIPVTELMEDKSFNSPFNFFNSIQKFAFYPFLKEVLFKAGYEIEKLLAEQKYDLILDYFLTEKGLNYGNLPKGLLIFHAYEDGNRYAVEEHFQEGIHYACSYDGEVKMHFTVSAEHQELFQNAFEELIPKYEKLSNMTFQISTSLQKPSTDTIAVDMNNEPFRLDNGSLLFWPAGHGALIENLNEIDEDVIFIKNIDNVVPDKLRDDTYKYKKVIGGLMLKLQNQIFENLDLLDEAQLTDDELDGMKSFIENQLQQKIHINWKSQNQMEKIDFLYTYFNRPIRVCGMVKNEGEPGGGPFRVDTNGISSLQIVEGSQIDLKNPSQVEILKKSTHFNPVDLVCGVRDYEGDKFNLLDFIDPNTGFISVKSKDGRDLKAQELPGLWNGAMADWITVFVEVPISTFNPVKTINDLLRPQHQ